MKLFLTLIISFVLLSHYAFAGEVNLTPGTSVILEAKEHTLVNCLAEKLPDLSNLPPCNLVYYGTSNGTGLFKVWIPNSGKSYKYFTFEEAEKYAKKMREQEVCGSIVWN